MSLQRSKTRSQKCSNFNIYSCLAQSVERLTVNQDVTGSSPVTGAKTDKSEPLRLGFVCFLFREGELWSRDTDRALMSDLCNYNRITNDRLRCDTQPIVFY